MVTIFRELNFRGEKFLWVSVAHRKATVIKLAVSQTRPRPFFTFWSPFLLLNKQLKEHVIDIAKM